MPYKFETNKLKIPRELDRRVKLPLEKHQEIRQLSMQGMSQRKIASLYGVSRRLIVFILFPERLEELKKNKKQYKYTKEKHSAWAKNTRDYKKSIVNKLEN